MVCALTHAEKGDTKCWSAHERGSEGFMSYTDLPWRTDMKTPNINLVGKRNYKQ